jgi:DNA (cytosine-5)-methyltransferase 1
MTRAADAESWLGLSLFPGVDLFGLGFLAEWPELCLVRGPDVLYGSLHDVRRFHPPAGVFRLVFGGPPCQAFSPLRHLNPRCGAKHGNLIPEFERIVAEAQPECWVMEQVAQAPEPHVPGYVARHYLLNNRWFPDPRNAAGVGAEQRRKRRISFGTRDGRKLHLDVAPLEAPLLLQAVTSSAERESVRLVRDGKGGHRPKRTLRPTPSVVAGHGPVQAAPGEQRTRFVAPVVPGTDSAGHTNFPDSPTYSVAQMCVLQGLPADFADALPFTAHGKRLVIGNGVPMPLGRAVVRAVRRAMGLPVVTGNGSEDASQEQSA